MDLAVYIGSIAVLVSLSKLRPAYDGISAGAIAIILALYSGLRQGGFDYDEYLLLIDIVRMGPEQSLLESLLISKEPLFGIVVHLVGLVSENPVFVFLTLGVLAAGTKLIYAFSMRRDTAVFLGLYAIFLAPGLEFAAIRAGVALGFLALATQNPLPKAWRILSFVLASVSHVSVVPGGLFISLTARINWRNILVFALTITLATFLIFSSSAPTVFERAADYENNRGTAFALVLPATTIAIFLFSVGLGRLRKVVGAEPMAGASFIVAMGFAFMGLGAALPIVTASTRFLEIAWFFGLSFFVRVIRFRSSPRLWVGFVLFLALLAVGNLERSTWKVLNSVHIY